MSVSRDRQILIELIVNSGHPSLLAGLDAWLQLGLISDSFVRQLGEAELSCFLPEVAAIAPAELPAIQDDDTQATDQPVLQPATNRRQLRQREPQPNLISQALQAFMAEISVVWLLFLGVFLVVVSSGVLAATQWQNVSALGQYGILFGYTVLFWLASLWTRRQPSLRLTSQMLAIATLLLVPVNFWMMDGFRLWNSGVGVGIVALCAIGLTGIVFTLLRRSRSIWMMAAVVLLSWLHIGWHQPGIPLLATYLGTIGATAALVWQDAQRQRDVSTVPPELDRAESARPELNRATSLTVGMASLNLSPIAIAMSALLLIGRALFVVQLPVDQLGLAVGVCGWLLGWLARRDRTRVGWSRAGTVLLMLAWLVTVTVTPPWQAVAISGLGLGLLADALWHTGRSSYLIAGFSVGLQLVWLVWRLLPSLWQTQLVTWATQLAGTTEMPFALLGLGFFPYVWLVVGVAFYLRSHDRARLAQDAEWLALGLGGLLVGVSLGNPLVRSLTLTLASLTLIGVMTKRQQRPPLLIYLAHGATLASLFAWIDFRFPALSAIAWVGVLLAVMTVEWGYSALQANQQWSDGAKSAWLFGLILASVSYTLLWDTPISLASIWKLSWLLTPALLTALTYRDRFPVSQTAGCLSGVALVLAQPLLIEPGNVRLVSLGTATLLMLLNTAKLQHLLAAIATVGFGLGFWSCILWEILQERLTADWVVVLLTVTVLLMWGLRGWLSQRRSRLAHWYCIALDGWAIAVLLLAFLVLGFLQLVAYWNMSAASWQWILAGGLLVAATLYRTWQRASNGGWYAIAWSLELLIISILLLLAKRSLLDLAVANLALGFLAQVTSDVWISKTRGRWESEQAIALPRNGVVEAEVPEVPEMLDVSPLTAPPSHSFNSCLPSWHLIPLAYGLLGVGLAHSAFTATTGFYTLVAALLGCQVGRRTPNFQPITYLALVSVSFGAYELLTYQLLQAKGGNPGDGITLLASLATAIAIGYRLVHRPLTAYLRLTSAELSGVAHLHWGLGNVLLVGAVVATLSRTGQTVWTAIALLLAGYALATSHRRFAAALTPSLSWTYAGILDLLAAIAAGLWLLLPSSILLNWAGAIAALLAVGFYQMPWQQWGWERLPWRRTALLLPGIVVLLTAGEVNIQSLLVVAAFYAWVASVERQIRFSYIGVLFADWALVRWLQLYNATQPLWYAAIIGSSLLYLAQVDPTLQAQHRSEQRHWLRSLATALICLTGFYQANAGITGLSPFVAGFVAIAVEFGFIVLGLWQRVRAFLYVGTLTFMLQVFWQLWRFVRDYSLLLWIFGIVVGLILIWVAATFEARRAQANALLQRWITELEDWQ